MDWHRLDLRTLAARLASGEVSATELARHMLARIETLNPRVNALSEVIADRALADAARIDDMRRQGVPLGPLAGIPVIAKDNMDTVPAACPGGLPFLSGHRPAQDAPAVQRLRRAGAVVLGVAHSDPGTFGVRTDAVLHPHQPELIAGGSSGGSAAALAAGFAPIALGSDTGGSIRIPSACCLTVGLKPTYGRVPKEGVLPLAPSLDHVGPMARGVRDLAILAAVLDDMPSSPAAEGPLVIGVDAAYYGDADDRVKQGMEVAMAACRDLGWSIREVSLPAPTDFMSWHMLTVGWEAAHYYRAAGYDQRPDLPQLAADLFAAIRRYSGADYAQALRRRGTFRAQVEQALQTVDFLLLPTLAVPTPRRGDRTVFIAGVEHEFTAALVRYTSLFNHTGHPALALPATREAPGRGIGVQLVGRHHDDGALLAAAERLEAELALPVDMAEL
ncbi:amidase [Rhodoligotrophos defluvii]|uniref:amidase n=1 Tax=Rhodoligotrophos defluvii TaxID=2561934 RepID=UPI0010CA00D5|nr:amidase [Rhodoligotrophos defluvii]